MAAVVMRMQPWLAGKAGTKEARSPLPARGRRYCMTVLQVAVDKLVAGRTATRHDHQSPSTQFRGEALAATLAPALDEGEVESPAAGVLEFALSLFAEPFQLVGVDQ